MNAHAKTIVPQTHAEEADAAKGVVSTDAPTTWAEVVAAFEAAVADWKAKEHLHDDDHFAALGRKPTEDETEVGNAAIAALIRAEYAVLSYAPRSADEYGRKASLLLTHPELEALDVHHILMEDAKRIASAPAPDAGTLDAAIAALDAFMPTYQAASSAHTDAEEALSAADVVDVPPPDVLVRISPPFVMKLPTGDATVPEVRTVYKTVEGIDESDELSDDEKAIKREALASWRAQIEAAERASGLWNLRQAERNADAAYQAALQRVGELGAAILKAPARSSDAIVRKLAAYARSEFYESWQDFAHDEPALAAVLQDVGAVDAA